MKYHQRSKLLLLHMMLVPIIACSTYGELKVNDKVILTGENSRYSFSGREDENKPGFKSVNQKSIRMVSTKYLVRINNSAPESKILNMGVDEALKGNYIEAEILFNEISRLIRDGSVENNLGVIYELTKRKKSAMEMYTDALVKSPENQLFRSNLLSFINHNKFKSD